MTPAAIRARYVDRIGRPITDPHAIHARYVHQQLARLETLSHKRGNNGIVTVADLARAAKSEPLSIVNIIRAYDMWHWGVDVDDNKPVDEWEVFTDGE